MKKKLFGLTGILLVFSLALIGCPTESSGTDTETSVIKVTNVPSGTGKIFVTVYDDFTAKTTLAYGEASVSGGTGTLSLLAPGGKPWAGTDTVAIAALADRASGKRWDSVELGDTVHTLDWSAGAALEGELFDAIKLDAQTISPLTEEDEPVLYELEDLSFDTSTGIKYYSLSTGTEVDASKANTTEWDIAVERHTNGLLFIYTNSGDTSTASGSAGDGRVWFTNKTDFDDVKLSDRVTDFSGANAEYAPYVTDKIRWIKGMGQSVTEIKMNMMTYFGFASGTGLDQTNAFTTTDQAKMYEFDKKAAYIKTNTIGQTMPPQYGPTKQVYIIRHADGAGFSKFQVGGITFASPAFAVSLKFIEVKAE